ncbi:MAG: hypothetical protein ACM3ZB_13360 [bacterium]|jgi:hypothetical protein
MPDDVRHQRLTELFTAYREALPDPDASVNFMPRLWEKIEARENQTVGFRRMARALITAAAAASMLMGAWVVSHPVTSPFYTNSYMELLAASENSLEEVELISQQLDN